jgi:hypothetical protein
LRCRIAPAWKKPAFLRLASPARPLLSLAAMRGRTSLLGGAGLFALSVVLGNADGCASPDTSQGDGSGQGGSGGTSGGGSGGGSSGGSSGSGGVGSDAAVGGGGDAGGPGAFEGGSGSDAGAPGADASTGGDDGSGASQCPSPCGGATPLCDQGICKTCTSTSGCSGDAPVCDTGGNGGLGQCKQVRVLAIELPDPQMTDRAHAAYQRHANVWFPQTATDKKFFTFEVSNDWDQLKTIAPAPGLVVMFVDISPSDPGQQAGFRSYMEKGGAWFGCHFSGYNDTDPMWSWRWYFDDFLGGGLFVNNTWQPVSANLDVEDPTHPATQGMGTMFTSAPSEWYRWTNDLRTNPNIKILLSVDPSSFPLGTDPNQSWYSGYYPIAWTNTKYKMMYVNMGHEQMDYPTDTALSSTFDSPTQNIMYTNAFRWLGGAM